MTLPRFSAFSFQLSTFSFQLSTLILLLLFPLVLPAQPSEVRCGAEVMLREGYYDWESMHIAVVANQSSLVEGTHLVDTLLKRGAHIEVIFCPEHGFRGTSAAGEQVGNSRDPSTGIPIVSLYGKSKKPTARQLQKVDLVLFDLQDVGCRFYTYISTLHYVMQACAENGVTLAVLDRPNPNGHYVDGPVLEAKYRSFVGMHPGVPVVYGMTILEYACMINGEGWIGKDLHCNMECWKLEGYSHDSACCRSIVLPVPPSPNLRTAQSIALYPSLCLFEGTTISVGRGTPYPFEVIGNGYKRNLRKVKVPSRFNLDYLLDMYRHTEKGSFFLKSNFFEKLAGTLELRRQLEAGADEASIRASWAPGLQAFLPIRAKYLLYSEK